MERLSDRWMFYCGLLVGMNASVEDLKHIQDLIDAEEQGLLLKLPCKVGDTVYGIVSAGTKIVETTVLWIESHRNGILVFSLDGGLGDVVLANLGKTWFLSKEEAEAKLRELQIEVADSE